MGFGLEGGMGARAFALGAGLSLAASAHAVVDPAHGPYPDRTRAASAVEHSGTLGEPGEDYAADQVLVRFEQHVGTQAVRDAIALRGDAVASNLETRPRVATLELGSDRSVAEAIRDYESDPYVAHAQPNYIYRLAAVPDDPSYGDLWGLDNDGQVVNGAPGSAGRDISAEKAWDLRTDCSSVTVAVLDGGVNYEHEDLADNMWSGAPNHGRDFVGDDETDATSPADDDPMPYGGNTHGTHVAGTIAAVGDNGVATTGVCWQAQIMSVRVFGSSQTGFTADIVEGIDYAVTNGARILNMSFGGPGDDPALKTALADARDAGVLAVAAAGNNSANVNPGQNPSYPCSYDLENIVCVAALDQDYGLAGFSNFGDAAVDVGAPGVNVLSSFPGPTVTVDFANWDLDPSWAVDTCDGFELLVNPADWCSGGQHANGIDASAYQVFDFRGALGGRYRFAADFDLGDTDDVLRADHEAGSNPGSPFDSSTLDLGTAGGDSGGFRLYTVPVQDCAGTLCSVGAKLATDGSITSSGVAVGGVTIQKVVDAATARAFLEGTSMAAPHVSGVAALAWAVAPAKNYSEIRSAIVDSGDDVMALDTTTTSGRAVNARSAIERANDAPSAQDASVTTAAGSAVDVTVNASDPNGHSLSYAVGSEPSSGSVSLSGNTVTYEPDSGFSGSDSFTVQVADGYTGTATSTVSVTVESGSSDGGGGGGGGSLGPYLLLLLVGLLGVGRSRDAAAS